jgi:hypothetical protein
MRLHKNELTHEERKSRALYKFLRDDLNVILLFQIGTYACIAAPRPLQ